MREANLKFRRENPELIKLQNEKKKLTFANKTEEQKRITNEKRSAAIKAWWESNKHSNDVKKRNSSISKTNKGKVRSQESKSKQSLSNTGKKQSIETKIKRAKTRESKAARGESLGLKSKFYKVGDFMCQGKSEKAYIENLYANNLPLPLKRGSFVETPFGVYHPDFEFEDYFVEIKSQYTYKIYLGEINNIDGVLSKNQKEKLEWTSNNIKEVKLIIV